MLSDQTGEWRDSCWDVHWRADIGPGRRGSQSVGASEECPGWKECLIEAGERDVEHIGGGGTEASPLM